MKSDFTKKKHVEKNDRMRPSPPSFEEITKIEGDHTRHIEQLWDEIKKLKFRVDLLEDLRK